MLPHPSEHTTSKSMLPTHHVTTKGPCHLATNLKLDYGSNTSTLSPGANCLNMPGDYSCNEEFQFEMAS